MALKKNTNRKNIKGRKAKKKVKTFFNDVEDDVLEILNKALKDKK